MLSRSCFALQRHYRHCQDGHDGHYRHCCHCRHCHDRHCEGAGARKTMTSRKAITTNPRSGAA